MNEILWTWWKNKWWESSEETYHLPAQPADISVAADYAARYFDDTWLKSMWDSGRIAEHPIAKGLISGKGYPFASTIVAIGEYVRYLERVPGFQSKLRKLKGADPHEAVGAMFELSVAMIFARDEAQISFPAEGKTKSHDIQISLAGEDAAIECKRLRDEHWEDWASDLMHDIIANLPAEFDGKQVVFDVQLHPQLSQILVESWHDDGTATAIRYAFAKRILDEIYHNLRTTGIEFEFAIGGIASVRAEPKRESFGRVQGMSISDAAVFRRILNNGLLKAMPQLPNTMPGIVVVYSKHLPNRIMAELVFDSLMAHQKEKYENVVALLMFTQQYMLSPRIVPYLFINKHSRHAHLNIPVIDLLNKYLTPSSVA